MDVNNSNNNSNNITNSSSNNGSTPLSISCCNSSDVNDIYKCAIHHRCLEFLCRGCNVMLCANCSISACHRGHVIEDFDTVVKSLHTGGQLQQRLDDLWSKTKEYDSMIDRFRKNEEEVTDYYRQLHEYLMVEEHKIKKPLQNEREMAEQKIQTILQEMKEINNVIATVSLYTRSKSTDTADQQLSPSTICTKRKFIEICEKKREKCNKLWMSGKYDASNPCFASEEAEEAGEKDKEQDDHHNLDICMEKVMKSIRELGSVSELIERNRNMFQVNQCERPIELLHLVQKYMTLMKCNGDPNPPYPYVLRLLDIAKTKNFLGHIYELLDDEPTHDHSNSLFTTGADGSFVYDIVNSKWLKICDDAEKRSLPICSVASDCQNVYVFGGCEGSSTYSRLSIDTLKWDKYEKITTGEGGYGISACYDGQRYIYLVGGCYNKISLKRIDRFDTQTMTFSRIGNLTQPRVGAFSFYHSGNIYIVGGIKRLDWKSILMFDTQQGKLTTLVEDIGISEFIISACFDGTDLIYILDKKNFFTISISTKTRNVLSSPNISGSLIGAFSMIYLNTCNVNSENYNLLYGEVYFFGGKQYGSHVYCVGSNAWHFVNDHDQNNRSSNGSIKFFKKQTKC